MKIRFFITETYCCDYLSTSYFVTTEERALEILQRVKALNKPNTSIKIEKQTKKWYQRHWQTPEIVAEWRN